MILEMSKVRVLGPRDLMDDVLRVLQDFGLVHLTGVESTAGVEPRSLSARERRKRKQLRRILEDIEAALAGLGAGGGGTRPGPESPDPEDFAVWARMARRVRRRVESLNERAASLQEEEALILKYRGYLAAFESSLERIGRSPDLTALGAVLRAGDTDWLERLEDRLAAEIGDGFHMETRTLDSGDLALLLVLPVERAARVEQVLADARVPELRVPDQYGGGSLAEAVPRMLSRLGSIPEELAEVAAQRSALARERGPELRRARRAVHDRLSELEARTLTATTRYAFVLEGWTPRDAVSRLRGELSGEFGETVVVEEVSSAEWTGEEAPVVLSNPRIFRPFETVVKLLPLPRYGTIDPTPYVAVFFPMFFGLMLGDMGYGLLLAAVGLLLHWRSSPGSIVRAVAEIAGPCAAFTIIFGLLYGEFFGDLGRTWFGLEPLVFDREEGIVAAMILAAGLGFVHILLGLGLGVASALRGQPRHAIGRGIAAIMVVLIALALLAVAEVLPDAFFTPSVIALLVLFPVLVVLEGLIAPVELLSTLGNILSYARIMALGTASVMLAVVANRMVGAMGGAVVGILFALLFHLVNFAVGVFSPAIHALRLHYVEFFGKFFSPGGVPYHPFRHWRSNEGGRG